MIDFQARKIVGQEGIITAVATCRAAWESVGKLVHRRTRRQELVNANNSNTLHNQSRNEGLWLLGRAVLVHDARMVCCFSLVSACPARRPRQPRGGRRQRALPGVMYSTHGHPTLRGPSPYTEVSRSGGYMRLTRSAKAVVVQTARFPRSIRRGLSLAPAAPFPFLCRLEICPAVKSPFWAVGDVVGSHRSQPRVR